MFLYVRGLKTNARTHVETLNPPVQTFAAAMQMAEKFAAARHQAWVENPKFQKYGRIQPDYGGPKPMDLNGMQMRGKHPDPKQRKKVDPKEIQRRQKHGLCLHCGDANHFVKDCPQVSKETRDRWAKKKADKDAAESGNAQRPAQEGR